MIKNWWININPIKDFVVIIKIKKQGSGYFNHGLHFQEGRNFCDHRKFHEFHDFKTFLHEIISNFNKFWLNLNKI